MRCMLWRVVLSVCVLSVASTSFAQRTGFGGQQNVAGSFALDTGLGGQKKVVGSDGLRITLLGGYRYLSLISHRTNRSDTAEVIDIGNPHYYTAGVGLEYQFVSELDHPDWFKNYALAFGANVEYNKVVTREEYVGNTIGTLKSFTQADYIAATPYFVVTTAKHIFYEFGLIFNVKLREVSKIETNSDLLKDLKFVDDVYEKLTLGVMLGTGLKFYFGDHVQIIQKFQLHFGVSNFLKKKIKIHGRVLDQAFEVSNTVNRHTNFELKAMMGLGFTF